MARQGNYKEVIERVNRKLERTAQKSVRETALESASKCVLRSPVDTGAFKAHWFLTTGAAASGFDPKKVDPDGGSTLSRLKGESNKLDLKQRIYITNTAPYAIYLERGYSAQAPAGIASLVRLEMGLLFKRKFVFDYGQKL